MLDFQQKRKIRSFAYNRATLIALSILVLIFIHGTWGVYRKKAKSEEVRKVAENHLQELRLRDAELEDHIERLRTDSGVEEEIRSKFTVAKEGENMVIIVDDQTATTTSPKPLGFWARIKAVFSK